MNSASWIRQLKCLWCDRPAPASLRLQRHIQLRLEVLEDRAVPSAGTLDGTFGGDGRVTLGFDTTDDGAYSVAIDGNGKVVAAGYSSGDFALARFNADGSLDTTFDGDGKVTTDFASSNEFINSIAIDANGKIVAAGFTSMAYGYALARYNADGSLDTTFDGDGKLTIAFSSANGATSVAIDGNGKIVVAGDSNHDFALARLNADGSLDTTFDGDGKVTTTFGSAQVWATSLAIDASGKIVVAGSGGVAGSRDFQVARYNADGSLDSTFDGDGKVTTDFGSYDYANSVAIDGNGKIVLAGKSLGGFALSRYNVDGSLDTTFDGDGKVTSGGEDARSVAIDANGKIVAAGFSGPDFAVARYNTDGSLDATFDGGVVLTDFGSTDAALSMAIDPNGKIVAAGECVGVGHDFALARYGNYAPTDITLSNTTIAENAGANAVVGDLGAVDPDMGETLTFSLVNGALNNDQFNISVTELRASESFDFEGAAGTTRQVLVQVTDSANNTFTENFTISIANVNEAPAFTSSDTPSVPENTSAVTTVTANDPESDPLAFSLSGGADESGFAINSTTGALTFKIAPNFEIPADTNRDNVYLVTVEANDGHGHKVTQDISITVTDVGEPPKFSSTSSNPVVKHGGTFKAGQTQHADVNGDGRADLIFQGLDNSFWLSLSNGSGFNAPVKVAQHGGSFTAGQAQFADVSGDDRADLIFQGLNNSFWLSLSNGSGFNAPVKVAQHGGSFTAGQAQFTDVSGDDRADLIFQGLNNSFWLSQSNGGGFNAPVKVAQHGGSFTAGQAQYADVNGDGKADLIFQGQDNSFWLSQSNGAGFNLPVKVAQHGGSFTAGQAQYANVNGDGKADLIFQELNNAFWLALAES